MATEAEQQKIEFGKKLRELRKRRGLSAEQLGDKIGVARTTVFGYEQGQRIPDMITIKKIAELFNVTVDYLVGTQLKPPSHNVREVLSRSDLTWDGIPLTEEELKQTRDFLSWIIREKIPEWKEKQLASNEEVSDE